MGIEALYRKPRLSIPGLGHKVYPYLLRGMKIDRANQVWATDITWIPMATGYVYLVAIMDWASRKVLSWRLSNTLDTSFCLEALEEAIERYGCPESLTPTKGASLPRRRLPGSSMITVFGSAWTDGAGGWTMFL